tara:strand:+ start:60 stop:353 length:294 start_codon:yes stop_codon:yes gene_type:complete
MPIMPNEGVCIVTITKDEFISILKSELNCFKLKVSKAMTGYCIECEIDGVYFMPIYIGETLTVKLAEYIILNFKECLIEHTNKKNQKQGLHAHRVLR